MTAVDLKVRHDDPAGGVFRVATVEIDDSADPRDVSDGEGGGAGETEDSGVPQADVVFDGWVRRTDVVPLARGQVLVNLLVALDGQVVNPTVALRYFFPRFKVLSVKRKAAVRGGPVSFTVAGKSCGPYYPPGVPGP